MTRNNAGIVTIVLLGISHFSLAKTLERRDRDYFDNADCSNALTFYLDSEERGENVGPKLNSTDQRIFYFSKPTRISMECFARFPIEIQVDREMVR